MAHAKDKEAVAFYRHHGFIELPDKASTLFFAFGNLHVQLWLKSMAMLYQWLHSGIIHRIIG